MPACVQNLEMKKIRSFEYRDQLHLYSLFSLMKLQFQIKMCLYMQQRRDLSRPFLAEAKDDIAAVVCVLVKLQTNASTKMACLKRNLPTMTPIALHLVLLQIAVYFAM